MLRSGGCGKHGRVAFRPPHWGEREFFIDNLLVRIHVIIVMIRWTGSLNPLFLIGDALRPAVAGAALGQRKTGLVTFFSTRSGEGLVTCCRRARNLLSKGL